MKRNLYRILSLLLTLALTLGGVMPGAAAEEPGSPQAEGSVGEASLLPVEGVTLSDDGLLRWDPFDGAGAYDITVIDEENRHLGGSCPNANTRSFDLHGFLELFGHPSGKYHCAVTALDRTWNEGGTAISLETKSETTYAYTSLGVLDAPKNPHWEGYSACWDAVANATHYYVMVYTKSSGENYVFDDMHVTGTRLDLEGNEILTEVTTFAFKVYACSEKGYTNSDWSEMSKYEALPAPTPTVSVEPSESPSPKPSPSPSVKPTESPSPKPTETPSPEPTATPSPEPTETPSPEPTETPSPEPTVPTSAVINGLTYSLKDGKATVTGAQNANAKTVKIPTNISVSGISFEVTKIGASAFNGMKDLTSAQISSCVTTIGTNAFNGCAKLETVSGMAKVRTIGDSAFQNCKALTKIPLTAVTTIGKNAFSGCAKLKTVSGMAKVKTIGDSAFQSCKALTKITLTAVTTIGKNAFIGCEKLKTVSGMTKVKKISDSAFQKCKALTKITLTMVTTIGKNAFSGCAKLKTVSGMTKVQTIGDSAFQSCKALTKITLGANVKTIGTKAFFGCKKLKSITIKTMKLTDGTVGKHAFKGVHKKATVKVPAKKLNAYKILLVNKGLPKTAKVKGVKRP